MHKSRLLAEYDTVKIMSGPWPTDVVLHQPYEAEQILLPESGSCLAVKTYLNMCNLPYEVRFCSNAEFMSPGGRMTKLPVLQAGLLVFAEFEPIANFIEYKTEALASWLDENQRYEMRSYVSLTDQIFTMAGMYISFMIDSVYEKVTAPRNGSVFPWPLNKIQNLTKKRQAKRLLKVYEWNDISLEEVIEKVRQFCVTLEMKLQAASGTFFYGEKPCPLDAIVFAHLFSILTTELPFMALARTVEQFKLLVQFCSFINYQYFNGENKIDIW